MLTFPISEAKAHLSRIVNEVERRDQPVTITRNGKPAVVVVSLDDFESWQGTVDVLSNPPLMAEIRAGLRALPKAKRYTLEDFFAGPK